MLHLALVVLRFTDLAVPGPETCWGEWKVGCARKAMEAETGSRFAQEENVFSALRITRHMGANTWSPTEGMLRRGLLRAGLNWVGARSGGFYLRGNDLPDL